MTWVFPVGWNALLGRPGEVERVSGERRTGEESAREVLAERLRQLREGSGRTYAALARRIGVSGSTLHRYCTGQAVPAEFAPVERLARLCGCTGEERGALHRLWLRADAERVERREAAPPGGDLPGGGVPGGDAIGDAGTEPPGDPSVARDADERRPPPAYTGRPAPLARARSVRRWVQALGVCAVAASVLALVAALHSPSRPEGSGRQHPVVRPGSPPFTWTSDDHVWKYGCGHAYLVGRPPAAVPPPPAEADAERWAEALGAVHAGETGVRITLQGSDERAVVLEALRIRVVERREPAGGQVHRMSSGCGGALTPRMFDVDLDVERPVVRSVPGNDSGEPIAAVSFPYRVSASDPEVLIVTGRAVRCDCDWVAELRWSSGGRSGTARIDDGGRPFRTSGAPGRPVLDYDTGAGRWVAEPDAADALPVPGDGGAVAVRAPLRPSW